MTLGITLTEGHVSKLKVTLHTWSKSVRAITFDCHVWSELYYTQLLPTTKGRFMTLWYWPKVISSRLRSKCTHGQKLCPGLNSLLRCLIWLIFQAIVVHDPWVCHDLDPRSGLQGQCQYTHRESSSLGHNSLLPYWFWIIFHAIVVHDPKVCHDLDPRNHPFSLSDRKT